MSPKSSPSPRQGATGQVDESALPQGHCRYILLLPEVKGQRCACVNFTLNRGMPGATCDCGHLACFHNKEADPSEMDLLKLRVRELEERLARQATATARAADRDDDAASQAILARVSGLEEEMERSREEFAQEIKRAFANSTLAWNSFQHVQRKVEGQEAQMNHVMVRLGGVDATLQRLDDRQLELQDADTYLEERIEYMQETLDAKEEKEKDHHSRGRDPRPRHRSTSPADGPNGADHPSGPLGQAVRGTRPPSQPPANRDQHSGPPPAHTAPATSYQLNARAQSISIPPTTSGIWTVHISLLPHATIPMPFERNTNAYQRCLSRGLHQVVPVRGPSAAAFCAAVDRAFAPLLRGRPWMPLQAELCSADRLQGLPMLRQLPAAADTETGEDSLSPARYDAEFLRRNCAVCDAGGRIESLYITMRPPHALSWHAVRRAPVFVEGLEESWEFDPLLDNDPHWDDEDDVDGSAAGVDDDARRPAAGDLVPAFPRPLKRAAATMTTPASDVQRAKRPCPLHANTAPMVDLRRSGVGTA